MGWPGRAQGARVDCCCDCCPAASARPGINVSCARPDALRGVSWSRLIARRAGKALCVRRTQRLSWYRAQRWRGDGQPRRRADGGNQDSGSHVAEPNGSSLVRHRRERRDRQARGLLRPRAEARRVARGARRRENPARARRGAPRARTTRRAAKRPRREAVRRSHVRPVTNASREGRTSYGNTPCMARSTPPGVFQIRRAADHRRTRTVDSHTTRCDMPRRPFFLPVRVQGKEIEGWRTAVRRAVAHRCRPSRAREASQASEARAETPSPLARVPRRGKGHARGASVTESSCWDCSRAEGARGGRGGRPRRRPEAQARRVTRTATRRNSAATHGRPPLTSSGRSWRFAHAAMPDECGHRC